eukprot:TRINITY_DN8323_c0_g1_i2.p1 TRINITY_DN8323_c0_g1~~TRINITY_DN8323_c0_g1_i2.p1  ORF type:complete len:525 (+),score=80.96 TRINITY_DN8323_c0_g1_i2:336-1910(+)
MLSLRNGAPYHGPCLPQHRMPHSPQHRMPHSPQHRMPHSPLRLLLAIAIAAVVLMDHGACIDIHLPTNTHEASVSPSQPTFTEPATAANADAETPLGAPETEPRLAGTRLGELVQILTRNGTVCGARGAGHGLWGRGVCVVAVPKARMEVASAESVLVRAGVARCGGKDGVIHPEKEAEGAIHPATVSACQRFTDTALTLAPLGASCGRIDARPRVLIHRHASGYTDLPTRMGTDLRALFALTQILGTQDLAGVDVTFVQQGRPNVHDPMIPFLVLYRAFRPRSVHTIFPASSRRHSDLANIHNKKAMKDEANVCFSNALVLGSIPLPPQRNSTAQLKSLVRYLADGIGISDLSPIPPKLHRISILLVVGMENIQIFRFEDMIHKIASVFPQIDLDIWSDLRRNRWFRQGLQKYHTPKLNKYALGTTVLQHMHKYQLVVTASPHVIQAGIFMRPGSKMLAFCTFLYDCKPAKEMMKKLGIDFVEFSLGQDIYKKEHRKFYPNTQSMVSAVDNAIHGILKRESVD